MGAMGVEGHGGRVERGKGAGMHWGRTTKHGEIGGAMEAWVHGGPWGLRAMEGGRAEQAERAERAGMHWGPLKSFDWV